MYFKRGDIHLNELTAQLMKRKTLKIGEKRSLKKVDLALQGKQIWVSRDLFIQKKRGK